MSKFFVASKQIQNEEIYIKDDDVNHIANVLRLKKDDKILVCDKDVGVTYQTQITQISKNMVVCRILNKIQENTESKIKVSIFQGLPKADKMEYIIQKTTEIGVKSIIPVEMRRCEVKLDEKDGKKKIQRWQKIAEVAAKQSGRDIIPDIQDIINIDELTNMINQFDLVIVAYEEEKNVTLKQILKNIPTSSKNLEIGIVIGPEGGIENQEIEKLKSKGAKIITLGSRILRTETAPIVMLSNIMYELET